MKPGGSQSGDGEVLKASRGLTRALIASRLHALGEIPGWTPDSLAVGEDEVREFAGGGRGCLPFTGDMEPVERARADLDKALDGARTSGVSDPLERLCTAFSLDETCRDAVAVLLALDTTPTLRQLALSATADPVASGVTSLFLAELVGGGHRARTGGLLSELTRGGVLERHALIAGADDPRTRVSLQPPVTRFLMGLGLEPADGCRVASSPGEDEITPLSVAEMKPVRDAMTLAVRRAKRAFRLALEGPDPVFMERTVAALAAEAGQPLLVVKGTTLNGPGPYGALRDALLLGALLYVEEASQLLENGKRGLMAIDGHPGPVAFASSSELAGLHRSFRDLVVIQVPGASEELLERRMAELLGDSEDARVASREVVSRFGLSLGIAEAACAEVRARVAGGEVSAARLGEAVRSQLRTQLGEFADVVSVGQGMKDLVLPSESKERLEEMLTSWRHREQVLEGWGFGARMSHSRGLTSLFYGPPGTGKTMAAGIMARELGLEVFRVDLSRVVDKYIGETEKHLSRVFEEAERGQVMLLFDEADSLFGRRTSGGSSVDRYANMEVNYLLQRMERYEGVVVLTTNNERQLDEAFKRRIRYRVYFPLPTKAERERIWRGLFPAEAATSGDLDWMQLAGQYEMSGGHIRNAMLRAAYLSAEAGGGVTMTSLKRAADMEYRELGKLVREEEGGDN